MKPVRVHVSLPLNVGEYVEDLAKEIGVANSTVVAAMLEYMVLNHADEIREAMLYKTLFTAKTYKIKR